MSSDPQVRPADAPLSGQAPTAGRAAPAPGQAAPPVPPDDFGSTLLRAGAAWAVYAVVLLVTVRPEPGPVYEPDIYWHLRVGDWVMENRAVTETDPFSYPEGKPWVAYSWLFEVLVYQLHRWLGFGGIILYRAALALLILLAVDGVIRRLQPSRLAGSVLLLAAALAMAALYHERPWLFTILFAALSLRVAVEMREGGAPPWWVWLLPLAYVLWANIHIQFVHGLFLLGLACAAPVIDLWLGRPADETAATAFTRRWWQLVGLTAACALATLANPYHARLYSVVVEYATQPGPYEFVNELKAMTFRGLADWAFLALFLAGCVALGRGRFGAFEWLLMAATAVFSFRSCRDVWYGTLAAVLVLARTRWPDSPAKPLPHGWALGAVLLAVLAAGAWRGRGLSEARLEADRAKLLPVRAAEEIERRGYRGPLFNDFNWGGYLMWRLRMPVPIDGRTNLHGDERILRIGAVFDGAPGWEKDPDLSAAGIVVAPARGALASLLMKDDRFVRAHIEDDDDVAWVFVAKGRAPAP